VGLRAARAAAAGARTVPVTLRGGEVERQDVGGAAVATAPVLRSRAGLRRTPGGGAPVLRRAAVDRRAAPVQRPQLPDLRRPTGGLLVGVAVPGGGADDVGPYAERAPAVVGPVAGCLVLRRPAGFQRSFRRRPRTTGGLGLVL